MIGTIKRTWRLAKASWGVLRQDRELIWLPVLGVIMSAIVAAVVLVPIALSTDFDAPEVEQQFGAGTYLLLFLMMMALTIISVFIKGALVHGANERMTGGDPTVASSISGAIAKLHRLVPWAVLTATVGLVLQALRERSGFLGRLIVGLIGGAWEVLTFLVVPVVMLEDVGAIEGVKRSGSLFGRTWGESLSARIGFGVLGFVAMIPAFLLIVAGAAVGAPAGFVLAAAGIMGIAVVALVMSALGAIFQTALYHYAVGNDLTSGFEPAVLQDSFAPK